MRALANHELLTLRRWAASLGDRRTKVGAAGFGGVATPGDEVVDDMFEMTPDIDDGALSQRTGPDLRAISTI
jgi:hypothetical protein